MNNFRQKRGEFRGQTMDGLIGSPSRPVYRRPQDLRRPIPAPHAAPISIKTERRLDTMAGVGGTQKSHTAQNALAASAIQHSLPKIRLDLSLPGEPAENYQKRPLKWRKQWSTVKRWSFRAAAATLALVIGVGGFLFAEGYLKLNKVFNGGTSAAALQANVDPTLLKGEGDGRVNILLLGVGGIGHDGSDLTDTMVLASIDPVNNKATLLSMPRDLWVKMPNNFVGNYQKINAAYESGKYEYLGREDPSDSNVKAVKAGFQAVDQTVEGILGVPIHYNVLVNFQAFQQAVNTVGGVTVNVPAELYDPTMAWENDWNPVLAKPGLQTFNGKKALMYVRSRETSSDFARAERQRAVLLALKDKVMTIGTLSNPIKIANLMSAFGNNVVTDFSLSDVLRLYSIMKNIDNTNVTSIDLVTPPHNLVTTADINGLSVVEPRAGEFDYSGIQDYVRGQLKDGYIVKENAKVELLNGTGQPGLASDEAAKLKSYGYNVTTVDDAPTPTYTQTVLVDLTNGKDKYTKHYLERRFGVTATTQVPDPNIHPGTADFVIILGDDETTTTTTSQN